MRRCDRLHLETRLLREAAIVGPPLAGVGVRGPWLPVARVLAARGLLSFVARGRDERGFRVSGYAITFEGRQALDDLRTKGRRRNAPSILFCNLERDHARWEKSRDKRRRAFIRDFAEFSRQMGRAFLPEYRNGEVHYVPNPAATEARP